MPKDPLADVPEDVKSMAAVPQPSGTAAGASLPQPQQPQDAREVLRAKRERVVSGVNAITVPPSKEMVEPRFASTDIRLM